MNQEKLENCSFRTNRVFKPKVHRRSRLGYFSLTAYMGTIALTVFSSAWLPSGQSFGYSDNSINPEFILAQEESEIIQEERQEIEESAEELETEATESMEELETEATESMEELETEATESMEELETEATESMEEIETEATESMEEGEEEGEELPFEEAKESLEEEIDERYEEWESAKQSSEFSHSVSAIATIIMTAFIVVLGMELLEIPYRRAIILVLGLITVFTQLNSNVFLLNKSLAGYEILIDQSLFFKERLEEVETEAELREIREQFQELILESKVIE